MGVYVGVSMWPFRNMMMCHMIADTEEELEDMARKIGLRQEWRQGGEWSEQTRIGDLVHYDIATSKRNLAIKHGAIALDTLEAEAEILEKLANSLTQ